MENKIKQEKKEIIEYSQVCPYCKTKIISMYPNQLAFNYGIHIGTCKEKPDNDKKEQQTKTR